MNYHPALGVPGEFFYHYTSRDAAFADIIPERRLRLSPAFRVGDPLESRPGLLVSARWGSPDALADVEDLTASYELQALRRCSKILALTIDAEGYDGDAEIFGRGYARARMWEQYAERHAGVCLIYRRDELTATVSAQVEARAAGSWHGRVQYTQRGLIGDAAATLLPAHHASADETVAAHLAQHVQSIFFTKLTDWESEHEYRFVERSKNEDCTYVDTGDALAGVILGHAFPPWQLSAVFDLCDQIDAQPWRMSWEMSRPAPQMISHGPRPSSS